MCVYFTSVYLFIILVLLGLQEFALKEQEWQYSLKQRSRNKTEKRTLENIEWLQIEYYISK